jgi:serine/threonine protein kinase
VVGTLEYLAPELLRLEPASPLSDVWALGVVLFTVISGQCPFVAPAPPLLPALACNALCQSEAERELQMQEQLLHTIARGDVRFAHARWRRVSPRARATVRAMLTVSMADRIGVARLLELEWVRRAPAAEYLARPPRRLAPREQDAMPAHRSPQRDRHLCHLLRRGADGGGRGGEGGRVMAGDGKRQELAVDEGIGEDAQRRAQRLWLRPIPLPAMGAGPA